jgi:hypothetical protein
MTTRKLRLHGSPPRLRLVVSARTSVANHGFTSRECTPCRQDPSCRRICGGWSCAQSDYDHRKLRLHCSLPGLRRVEVDTSSTTDHGFTRGECTPCRQSPSCRRTYTPIPSREDFYEKDVGQSTSTRSGHKLSALPEVYTKH